MFQGDSIQVRRLDDGFAELCFDRQGDAINKLDARTVDEFQRATSVIAADGDVRGVLVSSAKDVFIVGADIAEFGEMFKQPAEHMARDVYAKNGIINAFEDLGVPSVVAINGFALGGGLELALAASFRVMSNDAQVGLPEVKLGLFPGFGGTVRLSRVAGPAVAVEWIAGGRPSRAASALAAGVVDQTCDPAALRETALTLLRSAADGHADWRARQQRKREPVPRQPAELRSLFDGALADVDARSPKHQPAAAIAVRMMSRAVTCTRAEALRLESAAFAEVAKTQAAASLVRAFFNDQLLKKRFKSYGQGARPVKSMAVLGAGIMGGGIAYTSALRGTPVRLKDIAPPPLALGMKEASRQLARQVKTGRIDQAKADAVLATIHPQLDDAGFGEVDLVIEAVVENLSVKHQVLSALEGAVRPDTVIASNTSSLRIDDIARPLARPENFVGMHFFNPVPVMALVEVVRGERTSDAAVSTAVAHAVRMGKTPVVVKDCPGFLVNRLITPYVSGFLQLLADGADFAEVDRVMEAFGWPMGPALLQDVVGMDTGGHVGDVIAAGYPQRMRPVTRNAVKLMVEHRRYGQKSGAGFYRHGLDPFGKPVRSPDPEAQALVATLQLGGPRTFGEAEIVDRLMLPMVVEAAHALEEGVVATAAELDMALTLGLGFPAYLGGALQYADWLGLAEVVARCERLAALGPAYEPTARMREMAATGGRFHG
ncbi:fatty acid oxidation complex subunit alpha FadB [Piscinibacter gummiphilus]|uniref:enoyl-CoA hydratase n=1 Tax=Piscinibacter gummiphilus TaxID=946333 RepID=A0A1W6L606_9BURK|nr:fatty acid oxidation complex subunit alpha FadB [Piscinibacter gummiphilus]ARN19725.1 multifunctional fatty acid oxidation complex subunit alpha [Piscinibacter gummiphilus]ATU64397.1 fatty acid oxidation complex subunit alpha FadB [Piscinibacter gummiphilus]GLS95207.1 fatty acid oxidation complex subunit alpha [Piscinibacter gummiphilus]